MAWNSNVDPAGLELMDSHLPLQMLAFTSSTTMGIHPALLKEEPCSVPMGVEIRSAFPGEVPVSTKQCVFLVTFFSFPSLWSCFGVFLSLFEG